MSEHAGSKPVFANLRALSVSVVRGGELPAGTEEACAEADGNVLLLGSGVEGLTVRGAESLWAIECDPSAPRTMAESVIAVLGASNANLVLPASPDGRDLAPLLAQRLGRPLFCSSIRAVGTDVQVTRANGWITDTYRVSEPYVATLIPGTRGLTDHESNRPRRAATALPALGTAASTGTTPAPASTASPESTVADARPAHVQSVEVLPPDPSTMDLTEATRIVGGGQGLGSAERFEQLARIGRALGASLGGTRVASDAGWIPFERQIGTTGVIVQPQLYLSFGISGATQHTTGLGDPDHVISVNLDPSCPMMTMSDLAIVSDARAVLDALETRLGQRGDHA